MLFSSNFTIVIFSVSLIIFINSCSVPFSGIIHGRICDEKGEPVPNAYIAVFQKEGNEYIYSGAGIEGFDFKEADSSGNYNVKVTLGKKYIIKAVKYSYSSGISKEVDIPAIAFSNYNVENVDLIIKSTNTSISGFLLGYYQNGQNVIAGIEFNNTAVEKTDRCIVYWKITTYNGETQQEDYIQTIEVITPISSGEVCTKETEIKLNSDNEIINLSIIEAISCPYIKEINL